jgi:hypothetical protein
MAVAGALFSYGCSTKLGISLVRLVYRNAYWFGNQKRNLNNEFANNKATTVTYFRSF